MKTLRFFLLLCIVCITAHAQNFGDNQSVMWRITGKGMAKPSYVLGTIHFVCPQDYVWTDKMQECLTGSDKLCLEVNPGDSMLKRQLAALMDKSGKQLQSYFTPHQDSLVERYLEDSLHI